MMRHTIGEMKQKWSKTRFEKQNQMIEGAIEEMKRVLWDFDEGEVNDSAIQG